MVRKYVAETVYNSFVKPVVKAGKKLFTKKQKTTGEGAIKSVKPGTQLTKKRRSQDDFTNFRSKLHTSAGFDTATKNKLKMKHPLYKTMKKTSDIFTPKEPKFNKGGRVGLKFGSKKSNVQKIQETFGPKKKLSPKQMKIAKLAGNPKKIDAADFAKLRKS